GMPVWVPRKGELGGLSQINVEKAQKQGLVFKPRKETVQDTLNWYGKLSEARRKKLRAGISRDKESEVLTAWHTKMQS
ncbi:MAG: epimerase, partial [Gammaproteobacteria bacterium]|nr:epimerase [Gammaproteobacteria bacterium]